MRIDARGRKLWEVVDGDLAISGDTKASINRFNGGAFLSDDKTLLCGTRLSGEGLIAGRVLVVTSDGTISSAKDLFPNIPGATSAYINKCLAWNDGVALVGTFSRGMASSGWLMKLDKAGSISGQIEIPCIQAFDVVETANHDLLISSLDNSQRLGDSKIDRIDEHGRILATRHLDGKAIFVRSSGAEDSVAIVTQSFDGPTTLLRMDGSLHDVKTPVVLGQFAANKVIGLADQSFVFFGSVIARGATAAVARVYSNSSSRDFALEPLHSSGWINDAVPSDRPNEFASVRNLLSGHRAVLAWISVEK
jgi:hypothetical protein